MHHHDPQVGVGFSPFGPILFVSAPAAAFHPGYAILIFVALTLIVLMIWGIAELGKAILPRPREDWEWAQRGYPNPALWTPEERASNRRKMIRFFIVVGLVMVLPVISLFSKP